MNFVTRAAQLVGLSPTKIRFDEAETIDGWDRIPLIDMLGMNNKSEHVLTENSAVTRWHGCHILWALLYIKNGHPGISTDKDRLWKCFHPLSGIFCFALLFLIFTNFTRCKLCY